MSAAKKIRAVKELEKLESSVDSLKKYESSMKEVISGFQNKESLFCADCQNGDESLFTTKLVELVKEGTKIAQECGLSVSPLERLQEEINKRTDGKIYKQKLKYFRKKIPEAINPIFSALETKKIQLQNIINQK